MKNKIFLSSLLTIYLFAFSPCTINASKRSAEVESICFLTNPPISSTDWNFYGNQGIWVKLENCNVLGVTASLGEYFCGRWKYNHYIIPPMCETTECYYSIFGETPIPWKFNISTASSVAMITGHARWDSY